MNARGTLGLGCLLVGLVATTAGCSPTTTVSPVSPAVAFSASRSDVDQACSIAGMPRVIATRVMPMRGITAAVSDGNVWLRFATVHDPRVLLAIDPETLDVVTDATLPGEVAPTATRGAVEIQLQDHGLVFAWTEGSLNDGRHVKAVSVSDEETARGADGLGFEGSAVGRPAVAFEANGKGVLAFIESNETGFQVVVTRASCPAL